MKEKIFFGLSVKSIISVSPVIIFTSIVLSCFFISKQSFLLTNIIEKKVSFCPESRVTASKYTVADFNNNTTFLYNIIINSLSEIKK